MYALRYFPARYFPPRYFPKVGGQGIPIPVVIGPTVAVLMDRGRSGAEMVSGRGQATLAGTGKTEADL